MRNTSYSDASDFAKRLEILIVHNPGAGRGRSKKLDLIMAALARIGLSVTYTAAARSGEAERISNQVARYRNFDAVVVAGGDGTLNEVANGLAGTDIPVAVIPLGTGNVLAQRLGMRFDPRQIARAVAIGSVCRLPVGVCNGQRFLLFTGVGYDAIALGGVRHRLSRLVTKLFRVAAGIRAWLFMPPVRLRVVVNNTDEYEAHWIFVKNRFQCTASRQSPAPSDPSLAYLDFIMLRGQTPLAIAKNALLLFLGIAGLSNQKAVGAIISTARHIKIETGKAAPVQIDGEVSLASSLQISATDQTLSLIDGRTGSVPDFRSDYDQAIGSTTRLPLPGPAMAHTQDFWRKAH